MAVFLPRTATSTRASKPASYQLRNTARALGKLGVALSTEWDKMDDAARTVLVQRIQQLALDLGQLVERSGPRSAAIDPGAGSSWFEGLSFLTPREHEVLRALALGASTRRIGELLGVSTATVRSHVKSILAKLGVHSRIEAVALLLRRDARLEKPA